MSFKVGDRVTIKDHEYGYCSKNINVCTYFIDEMKKYVGKQAKITDVSGGISGQSEMRLDIDSEEFCWSECMFVSSSNQSTMRKRYRLLKDTPAVKKGAIYEEECEDGTQPFRCITPEYVKFKGYEDHRFSTREVIENNPEWFERVEPLYVPASKLAKVREILGLDKAKRGRPKKK